jgi:hypothetical protein
MFGESGLPLWSGLFQFYYYINKIRIPLGGMGDSWRVMAEASKLYGVHRQLDDLSWAV